MPTFEYMCESCEIIFEELLILQSEIKEFSQSHPCKNCKEPCGRVPSVTNFQFKGVAEGDPTKKGSSGSHDLDYPTLDKAIGRSSNRKWKEYQERKAYRDRVRREAGTNALTTDGETAVAADPARMDARAKAFTTLQKAKKTAG